MIGYGNRRRFVEERCGPPGDPNSLDYHFICDIERGLNATRRKGYPLDRMIRVAAAYGVTEESAGAALDGGELVPAPESTPALHPDRMDGPPEAVLLSGVLTPQAIYAAYPYATAILTRLRAFPLGKEPTGPEVFLDEGGVQLPRFDSARAAELWDAHRYMPEDERAWLIAALQADMKTTARPDSNVG